MFLMIALSIRWLLSRKITWARGLLGCIISICWLLLLLLVDPLPLPQIRRKFSLSDKMTPPSGILSFSITKDKYSAGSKSANLSKTSSSASISFKTSTSLPSSKKDIFGSLILTPMTTKWSKFQVFMRNNKLYKPKSLTTFLWPKLPLIDLSMSLMSLNLSVWSLSV